MPTPAARQAPAPAAANPDPHSGTWLYRQADSEAWAPFDAAHQVLLEEAHAKSERVVDLLFDGEDNLVDLKSSRMMGPSGVWPVKQKAHPVCGWAVMAGVMLPQGSRRPNHPFREAPLPPHLPQAGLSCRPALQSDGRHPLTHAPLILSAQPAATHTAGGSAQELHTMGATQSAKGLCKGFCTAVHENNSCSLPLPNRMP